MPQQPSRVDTPLGFPTPAISGTAPDSDRRVNLGPEIQSRIGVDASSHPPISQHDSTAAHILWQHIADGDGGAARFIVELEHGMTPWKVNPWRVLEAVTGRVIERQQEGAAAPVAPSPEGTTT